MATSDRPIPGRRNAQGHRTLAVTRYDLVLAIIPVALALSFLAGTFLSMPLRTAMLGGSAVSSLALVDAVFLHPPGRSPP